MSEYIKISDVMKIYKSLYNGYGTTASLNVPVFVDLLRTVAVKFPEQPESEDGVKRCKCSYKHTQRRVGFVGIKYSHRAGTVRIHACGVSRLRGR